ncbi:HD domain-containing protein [Candidatus Fermentibacteria bacterium]|nr:HD domain-containing protein [Candidatus Fermentibacteria bacterium]
MTLPQLGCVRKWWKSYVELFTSGRDGGHPLLNIKASHSERVAKEASGLTRELAWPRGDTITMEALGLVHDVGRFVQFTEHGTYADAHSLNHGERGWMILTESEILACVAPNDCQLLLDGTRYHNRFRIPDSLPPRSSAFLAVLRDADKLDIMRVVIDAIDQDGGLMLQRMIPHLSLDRTPSPEVIDEITSTHSCSTGNLRTVGDMLLMQLSWTYDMNCLPALRRLARRSFVDTITDRLPDTPMLQPWMAQLRCHIGGRIGTTPPSPNP